MSLKAFHVVFVSASAALAFGFAVWCFRVAAGAEAGAGVHRLAGVVAVVCGIGLIAYEAWFLKKMRSLP